MFLICLILLATGFLSETPASSIHPSIHPSVEGVHGASDADARATSDAGKDGIEQNTNKIKERDRIQRAEM